MIPDDKKEEVREAADIVDVVSDHVKLRRTGSNFSGLCPFHNEKTPSFSVSPSLGIFKCFGCGEGGDVFNFVMKMDGVGFEEAVRTLADRYNVSLPALDEPQFDPNRHFRDGIYHALRFAGAFFHQHLVDSDEAEAARSYLQKRGYPRKTIRKYGLGFAPDRYDGLIKAAADAGINADYLDGAGLTRERDRGDGRYDTFRGRLMFPIFTPSGKVIAFGARTLTDNKRIPKYINSPQTEVYNKSEALYGIQVAKNEIRKASEVLLVEGYTDVISLHQAGIGQVVSTSGTSLTDGQIRLMKRYADRLVMVFDADAAGKGAAVRGIGLALAGGMSVRVLTLPAGEDPDSYVRDYGMEPFEEYRKEHTLDFLRYLVKLARDDGRWDEPDERRKVISGVLEAIAQIPDELSRITYVQELSAVSRIGDRHLLGELAQVLSRQKRQRGAGRARSSGDASRSGQPGQSGLRAPAPAEARPGQGSRAAGATGAGKDAGSGAPVRSGAVAGSGSGADAGPAGAAASGLPKPPVLPAPPDFPKPPAWDDEPGLRPDDSVWQQVYSPAGDSVPGAPPPHHASPRHLSERPDPDATPGFTHDPAGQRPAPAAHRRTAAPAGEPGPARRRPSRGPAWEKELVRLMLTQGTSMIEFIGGYCNESHFEDELMRTFYSDIMERHQKGAEISVASYSRREDPYPQLVGELVLDKFSISERGMQKRGVRIEKDANPYQTARGSLRVLLLEYLKRFREEQLDRYRMAEEDQKSEIQQMLKRIQSELLRYQKSSVEHLFPGDDLKSDKEFTPD